MNRNILILQLHTFVAMIVILAANTYAQESDPADSVSGRQVDEYTIDIDIAKHPLKPPDLSSPRATLHGFLDNMNRSYRVLMEAHRINTETPGTFSSDSVLEMAQLAKVLFERGVHCLNLSEIPASLKRAEGYERALELKEILDRIELPPAHLIPDAEAIEKEQKESEFPELNRWRLPNTKIVIAMVDDGPREGEYLFSTQTVTRLGQFYKEVSDLPYKSETYTSDGYLEFYISTPGWLLPPRWTRWLPDWTFGTYLEQTIWQWCAYAIIWFLFFLLMVTSYRRLILRPATVTPRSRFSRRTIFCLIVVAVILAVQYTLWDLVNIHGSLRSFTRFVVAPFWWFMLGALIFYLGRMLAEAIIASPRIDPRGIQASYFRALFAVLGSVSGTGVFIYGLSHVGVSVIPLLTSLGIGGFAVALAARPTLEGIISSFAIFADKPYRVGHRVIISGNIGDVESIGLRSTKIRLLSGHLTVIPNEKMASMEIENIERRPYIRRDFNINITYDTPPDKIKQAIDILKDILAVSATSDRQTANSMVKSADSNDEVDNRPHPNESINQPDFPPRVYFDEFNNDSLNLRIIYWYHPPQYWDFLEHSHWVNVRIKKRFNAEGIDFAFPTQTLHLAGDEKRPLNVGQRPISDGEDI
jgi:MscS family membrane protein